jgi:NaMN:DMB phosphoribosyltransferase
VLQSSLRPQLRAARLLVFAADHGVTAANAAVSAYPRAVTPAMFAAIARGQAACNVLAAQQQCGVILCDVGIDADVSHVQSTTPQVCVLHRKVGWASCGCVPAGRDTQKLPVCCARSTALCHPLCLNIITRCHRWRPERSRSRWAPR